MNAPDQIPTPSPDSRGLRALLASDRTWYITLFFAFALLYTAVQNIGYFDASDSWNRFQLMKALVTTGSPYWTEPGATTPQTCLQTFGPALAALPFQAVGYLIHKTGLTGYPLQQVLIRATLMGTVFYTALWMVVLAALCRHLGATRRRALAVCGLAGVATLIFPYSKSGQGENLVGLGLTAITLLILQFQARPILRKSITIALIYSFLLTCKQELTLIFPVILAFFLIDGQTLRLRSLSRSLPHAAILLLGLVMATMAFFGYNYLRFQSFTSPGNIAGLAEKDFFYYFSHPLFAGLYIQLLSPGKGILWYCPVLLATLPWLPRFLRRFGVTAAFPYLCWAIMTVLYAKFFDPPGDTALGSRFQVSYLAFGVLPLLAAPPWRHQRRWSWGWKSWLIVCVAVSIGLQLLICAVSYNIDYHRRYYSSDTIEGQMVVLREAYYSLHNPLLFGFFQVAREGLLDLNFVRLRPLEGGIAIFPVFWWLLAGSAFCAGVAAWLARPAPRDSGAFWRGQIPALVLLFLALGRAGDPAESGLRVVLDNTHWARHESIAQDIAIPNMDDGREVYKVHRPFSIRWYGEMDCPEPGLYRFQVDSNQPLRLRFAHQENTVYPGGSEVEFSVLDRGWQPLEIFCADGTMTDRFLIKTQFPNESGFQPMKARRLKH